MILTCPSCGTQYVVKDGAIPPGGRQVRCASCKHSWHQDPEESEAMAEEAALAPVPEPESAEEKESVAEAALIEPRSGPEIEERAYEESLIDEAAEPAQSGAGDEPVTSSIELEHAPPPTEDWREPPQGEPQDDEFSPFPIADDVEPKRRSPLVTVLMLLLIIVALAAVFWFFAPAEWKAQLGLGGVGASPLALVTTHMDRQRLESGNELLTVTGRVINPTGKEQEVPALQAQLKSRTGQVVYRWTIAPPARTLEPGASASFNSAEVNVPPGGEELTISLGST